MQKYSFSPTTSAVAVQREKEDLMHETIVVYGTEDQMEEAARPEWPTLDAEWQGQHDMWKPPQDQEKTTSETRCQKKQERQ